jgi:hypothetical protein
VLDALSKKQPAGYLAEAIPRHLSEVLLAPAGCAPRNVGPR